MIGNGAPVSSPELSVIIPTYGRAEQTAAAVRSALAQDVDLEVVVVDDGSDPPLQMEERRVRIIRLAKNKGVAAARNAGASAASAPWLAFLDSDDIWPTGSLRPRLAAARAAVGPERTIWAAGFLDVYADGRRRIRMPKPSADPKDFASGSWMCPGSTALLSREAWKSSGGQDEALRRLEDFDWLFRWNVAGGRLAIYSGVGAHITRGGRGDLGDVERAVARLRAKHTHVPEGLKRRMESYFQLELGVARLHRGAAASGVLALAYSLLLHPRLQPSLERFWVSEEGIDRAQ